MPLNFTATEVAEHQFSDSGQQPKTFVYTLVGTQTQDETERLHCTTRHACSRKRFTLLVQDMKFRAKNSGNKQRTTQAKRRRSRRTCCKNRLIHHATLYAQHTITLELRMSCTVRQEGPNQPAVFDEKSAPSLVQVSQQPSANGNKITAKRLPRIWCLPGFHPNTTLFYVQDHVTEHPGQCNRFLTFAPLPRRLQCEIWPFGPGLLELLALLVRPKSEVPRAGPAPSTTRGSSKSFPITTARCCCRLPPARPAPLLLLLLPLNPHPPESCCGLLASTVPNAPTSSLAIHTVNSGSCGEGGAAEPDCPSEVATEVRIDCGSDETKPNAMPESSTRPATG